MEAPFVGTDDRIIGFNTDTIVQKADESDCIYEMRKYQLPLGYDVSIIKRFFKTKKL